MSVTYICKYCGKESLEKPFNFEGQATEIQSFIDKKTDGCECQKNKSFSLKCNKCGKEIILKKNTNLGRYPQGINVGYDNISENIEVSCECGNEISF